MRIASLAIGVLLCFSHTAVSHAEMLIFVTSGNLTTFQPGSIATVDPTKGEKAKLSVWAYDTAPSGRSFTGFNLAFDVDSPGTGFSGNFTEFTGSNPVIASNFNVDVNRPPLRQNYDLLVNASAGPVTILPGIDSPLKLFDISFTVDPNTPVGLYDFKFAPDARDPAGLGTGYISANNVASSGGAFTLVGSGGQYQVVPEPSSMALLGLLSVGGVAYRRIRRKAASK